MPHLREPSRVPGPDACLHCRAPLGSNDLLAAFPVGRRLAFDVERRRLWVVCATCRRWSSSVAYAPSQALSEILEVCERQHGDARRRLWTENVSLVRHASGVELIRVSGAPPAELAAWRYGDMLQPTRGRRASDLLGETAGGWLAERRDRLRGTLAAAPYLVGGIAVASLSSTALAQATALGLVLLAFFKLFTERSAQHERHLRRLTARSHVMLGRIAAVDGSSFPLHADQAWRIRLVSRSGADGWCLRIPARRPAGGSSAPAHEVEGQEAVRALRLAFPEVSRAGVDASAVRRATAAIECAGAPEGFLAVVAEQVARRGLRYATLGELPLDLRLPLEMAVDEVQECAVLRPEPEWQEAETSATLQGAAGL
jgi:hypothetical protein